MPLGFDDAALLGLQLGSAVLNSRSDRRQALRQREELARRTTALRQTAADSAASVEAAGRAAAAPLAREAGILRSAEDLRNPLLDQALTEAARNAAAPTVAERAGTGRDPRTARFQVMMELLSSRALTAREGIRAERVQRARQARAALLVQAGQFRTQAVSQAANLRLGAEQSIAGLEMPKFAVGAFPALAGGMLSAFQNLSDHEKEAIDDGLRSLFQGDDLDPDTLSALQAGFADLFKRINPRDNA